jgi:hypothetical protein
MSTRFYDTDLADAAWARVAPFLLAAGRAGDLALAGSSSDSNPRK